MKATKQDFRAGLKLSSYSEVGIEYILLNKYDEGIWEARVWDGLRHVGDVVIFESEAHFYQIIN